MISLFCVPFSFPHIAFPIFDKKCIDGKLFGTIVANKILLRDKRIKLYHKEFSKGESGDV